jgi:phenylacetate-coenzyme A ligase PaaK-like adenylate-forming protein
MAFWSECKSHSGIHVWRDNCIPEILPEGEKNAEMLSNSAVGKEGELVITNFFEALPLIRNKTGRKTRVEATAKCVCGSSDPRIRFIS